MGRLRLSVGKIVLATLLLVVPTLVFFAMSDRGSAGWTAQSQIFHGGTTWIETEVVKLNSVGMLSPAAAIEGLTVDQLLADWSVGDYLGNYPAIGLTDREPILTLEYTSDDATQSLRVVTAVTSRYMSTATPLVDLDENRRRLAVLENAHVQELDVLTERLGQLDESTLAYGDVFSSRLLLEEALEAVRLRLDQLSTDDRSVSGSRVVVDPFLLPQNESNSVSQTFQGLALGALLSGSFLLLVSYGDRRSTESLLMQPAPGQEAPQAFPR